MTLRKLYFKQVKVGVQFALSKDAWVVGDHVKGINIKVQEALLLGQHVLMDTPFNVISLYSGRAKTLEDDQVVYIKLEE